MTDDFRIEPAAVAGATKQLNELADRIDRLMAAEQPSLVVTPAGRDEVSGRVADTLNGVHTTFAESTGRGVSEIREIAATLDGHAADIVSAERDFSVLSSAPRTDTKPTM